MIVSSEGRGGKGVPLIWPKQVCTVEQDVVFGFLSLEIERFDWFIERIQTLVAFGWLCERSGEKTLCPITFHKSL